MRGMPVSVSKHGWSAIVFCGLSLAGAAHASVDCASFKPLPPVRGSALQLTPIAEELTAPSPQIGTGVGFAQLLSEGITVDVVLSRVQDQECRTTAAASRALPVTASAGAYQPQAGGDADPWRFNMTQDGKRMTADEFDAWMKARGVRVLKGPAQTAAAPAAAPPPPEPEAPKKKKR